MFCIVLYYMYIGHFGKHHNTYLFVPPNFACQALFPVSLGTYKGPKKKQKQWLFKIWGNKEKSIMVFSEVAL